MSGYGRTGAGSPYTFFDQSENDMHPATGQAAYLNERRQIIQTQPRILEHSSTDDHGQSSGDWSAATFDLLQHNNQHWSMSTHSSASSRARLSNNSIFSNPHNRISTVSTDSSSSGFSSFSRSQYHLQAEQSLTGLSSQCQSYAADIVEDPAPPTSRKRVTPRTPAPPKDYYKTCVSRKQRARRSETIPKYFCTVCREPFVEKADWKRHEETFQERPEEFQCDFCSAKYFLDKDFVGHHVSRHGCVPCNTSTKCSQKRHVQESKRPRRTRSGWGCGFCYHFSPNWAERCHHIANHFDVGGKTMADWNHSRVIYSLLQRPELIRAWNMVVESKHRALLGFGWNPKTTGRVEGYPDSTQTLQLQDELEYFMPGQDRAALVLKAFDSAFKFEQNAPPPVPPKDKDYRAKDNDYRANHNATLQDMMKETESWTQFIRSITNDDFLPTAVTPLDSGTLNDDCMSWYNDEIF